MPELWHWGGMRCSHAVLFALALAGCADRPPQQKSTVPSSTPASTAAPPVAAADPDIFCSQVFDLELAPRCAARLEAAQVNHAGGFRLRIRDGRVQTAFPISEGGAPGDPDDVKRIDFEYQDAVVTHSVKRSVAGKILKEMKVSADGSRAEIWDGYGRRRPQRNTTAVYTLALKRDAEGRIIERRYLDASGQPSPTVDGVYIHRYRIDGHGFPVEQSSFDAEAKPMLSDDGEHTRRDEFNSWGQLVSQTFWDLDSKPVALRSGVHMRRFKRDARGRVDGEVSFDVAAKPVVDRLAGCVGQANVYDAKGLQVGSGCFDAEGRPLKGNLGISLVVRTLDELDRPKQDKFLLGEQPAETIFGFHQVQVAREGRKLIRYLFDLKGVAPQGKAGGKVTEYDARGFIIMKADIDHAGRLWTGTSAPETKYVWDGGVMSEIRHLSPQGEAAEEHGISVERRTHDALSRITKRECFSADGSPVTCVALRVITFRFQGELLGKSAPFSRVEALAKAKQVRREIAAGGMSMNRAFRKYDPDAMILALDEAPQLVVAEHGLAGRLRKMLDGLPKGQVSEPDVGTDEVMIVERFE